MQMRAGRQTGSADIADGLALAHCAAAPCITGKTAHMGIDSAIAIAVAYRHIIA